MANEIGQHDDPESVAGNGSVIALLKRQRTLLGTIAAAGIIAGAVVVSGRLSTAPAVATAAAPTYTEGTTVPLSTDLAGTLRTAAGGGGGGNPTGGRLDSLRRLDTLRYLADGRLDSIQLIDSIRNIRQLPPNLSAGRLITSAVTTVATAAPPTLTEGQVGNLSVDLSGSLRTVSGELQMYFASVFASAAAANKDHLNLFNATGSGKTLRIRSISVSPELAVAITGLVQTFLVRRTTTVGTTCTAITNMTGYHPANVAIPAQVTANTNCTTDPALTFDWIVCAINGDEAIAQDKTEGNCYLNKPGLQPMNLVEGNGISVRSGALSGAWPVHVRVEFTF